MNILELFKPITTFVFDMDGVLTDGSLLVMPGRLMARRMNIKDGYALQLAVKKGYKVAAISGGKSEPVRERLKKLGIYDVYMGVTDKQDAFNELCQIYNTNPEHVLYMGDDVPDLVVMKKVGVPACPADACHEIKEVSIYISTESGGKGCVRDVIEQVMRLQGKWKNDENVQSK